jgi:phosphoenolpyruvate carboxykinase (ATP)
MSIAHTRAIIDAIHSGALDDAATVTDPVFGVAVPTSCPGVPDAVLVPKNAWADPAAYDAQAHHLAGLFHANFEKYADQANAELKAAAPKI